MSLLIPPYSFPRCWLMTSGDQFDRKTTLSPFSVAALGRLEELGISSWVDAWNLFWRADFLLDISPESRARFVDQNGDPLRGRVHLFTSEYDLEENPRVYPSSSSRRWSPSPSFTLSLDEEGSILVPPGILRSLARRVDGTEAYGVGQNFVFAVETEEGEILVAGSSALDFLLASWNTPESEEVEVVFAPTPPRTPE